ncbi:MAG: class I SAM-dependent methyltransferase [Pseudomonadota bacterium]
MTEPSTEDTLPSHVDFWLGADYADRLLEIVDRAENRHGILIRIIEEVYTRRFERALETLGAPNTPKGSFAYIPISVDGLIDILVQVREFMEADARFLTEAGAIRPVSFLEVGCGPGRNLDLVRSSQVLPLERVAGFDIVQAYIDIGRDVFAFGEDVFTDDAMSFDYGGWDVIFTYRPFSDDAAEDAFERHLVATADPGAYIISPLKVIMDELPEMDVLDFGGQILRKKHPGG